MSLAPEYVKAAAAPKRHMPGIGANGNVSRLIGVLQALELCPIGLGESLQKLAAYGKPVKEFFQVSVWDLDRALAGVECSIEQRMAFKASLDHAGLLTVPK
jgi:hypothetical protein